jgi:hypothetical protein
MVPLQQDDEDAVRPKGAGSTTFFTMPSTPRKPSEPASDLRRSDAIGTAGAPVGPPPGGGFVPQGAVPPSAMGAPVAVLGISGPVASMPGYPPPAASLPADTSQDMQRARSYRVFAVVAALMLMVCTTMIVTVLLLVFGVTIANRDTTTAGADLPPISGGAGPTSKVDTGSARPPIAPPVPSGKTPKPKPTGGGGAAPSPRPAAPAAPPSVGTVRITLGTGAPPFTSLEVSCSEGFRQREPFAGGAAAVSSVPNGECYANFKGGPPTGRIAVRPGDSKTCTFATGAPDCK